MRIFRYAFAGPLKYMAKAFMGWDGEKDAAGRKLLQEIGRVGREYDIDIWVKHLLNQMDKKSGTLPFNFVIVDDWRFPNELAFLQKNIIFDTYVIRVAGRNLDMPGNTASDVSENSLPGIADGLYDKCINNTGSYEDLEKVVDSIVEQLQSKFILE